MILGQDRAVEQFASAWATRKLHHAWLLAGPKGVGKATFARAAARRVLADAAGPPSQLPGLAHRRRSSGVKLVEAGSHPDMRWLERVVNEKTGNLNRNIKVEQIRDLGEFMSLSRGAVAVARRGDRHRRRARGSGRQRPPENARGASPQQPVLSRQPCAGRLLPTIRSRCRRLDFRRWDDDAMTSILEDAGARPDRGRAPADRRDVVRLRGAGTCFRRARTAKLEDAALAILRQGDPTNGRRSELAIELGKKGRRRPLCRLPRPCAVADRARGARARGPPAERALDAYAKARELAVVAPRLSLDPAATVFQIGGILASVAETASLKR